MVRKLTPADCLLHFSRVAEFEWDSVDGNITENVWVSAYHFLVESCNDIVNVEPILLASDLRVKNNLQQYVA